MGAVAVAAVLRRLAGMPRVRVHREITRSSATFRAIRHRPSVPSLPSAGSTSCPATRASNATAEAACPSSSPSSSTASSAFASFTRAETSAVLRLRDHPSRSAASPAASSRARCTAPRSAPAAPGTTRATRRTAAISWVMVSWVATASARIVESTARRRRPFSTPVSAITARDRLVDPVRTLRARQPPPPVHQRGGIEARVIQREPARRLPPQVTAGRLGRLRVGVVMQHLQAPSPTPSRSPAPTAGPAPTGTSPRNPHHRTGPARCAARNANMLPAGTRCPTSAPASSNCRSIRSLPCIQNHPR